jgi:hypothetical protein
VNLIVYLFLILAVLTSCGHVDQRSRNRDSDQRFKLESQLIDSIRFNSIRPLSYSDIEVRGRYMVVRTFGLNSMGYMVPNFTVKEPGVKDSGNDDRPVMEPHHYTRSTVSIIDFYLTENGDLHLITSANEIIMVSDRILTKLTLSGISDYSPHEGCFFREEKVGYFVLMVKKGVNSLDHKVFCEPENIVIAHFDTKGRLQYLVPAFDKEALCGKIFVEAPDFFTVTFNEGRLYVLNAFDSGCLVYEAGILKDRIYMGPPINDLEVYTSNESILIDRANTDLTQLSKYMVRNHYLDLSFEEGHFRLLGYRGNQYFLRLFNGSTFDKECILALDGTDIVMDYSLREKWMMVGKLPENGHLVIERMALDVSCDLQ